MAARFAGSQFAKRTPVIWELKSPPSERPSERKIQAPLSFFNLAVQLKLQQTLDGLTLRVNIRLPIHEATGDLTGPRLGLLLESSLSGYRQPTARALGHEACSQRAHLRSGTLKRSHGRAESTLGASRAISSAAASDWPHLASAEAGRHSGTDPIGVSGLAPTERLCSRELTCSAPDHKAWNILQAMVSSSPA